LTLEGRADLRSPGQVETVKRQVFAAVIAWTRLSNGIPQRSSCSPLTATRVHQPQDCYAALAGVGRGVEGGCGGLFMSSRRLPDQLRAPLRLLHSLPDVSRGGTIVALLRVARHMLQ
jgi:hypothetical protein